MPSDVPNDPRPGPLSGLRILDLTIFLAGPLCTMLLADLGADVIKVEMPGGDPMRSSGPPFMGGEGAVFMVTNRNKRSIVLDLKTGEGRALFFRLARDADVVIENFRLGVTDKLGVNYDALKAINPRLVYCSISGFGPDGPDAHLPAFDQVMQGYAGWMSVTGDEATGPMRTGPSVGDMITGLFATIGVVSALQARTKTGRGQLVTTSLFDSLLATLITHASGYFATGKAPKGVGNAHPIIVPFGTYDTADGAINVSVGTERQWQDLCATLGLADWAKDPDYCSNAGRAARRDEVQRVIAGALKSRKRDEWLRAFNACGIPASPVNDVAEAFTNPQAVHNHAVVELMHRTAGMIKNINNPIRMERAPSSTWGAAPLLGEHAREILAALGLSNAEIEALREKHVI